ncbi:DUF397 domain-containing protein [Streptomyces sp. NPDC003077]|uniref:DUF397 domain-containing protein n=1 Tax=Streptomyces sp. NPDC003077 TaxID=3154443 RepID=UPI0033BE820E
MVRESEGGGAWRKSSFSGCEGPNCVEAARQGGVVQLREGDAPATILHVSPESFEGFVGSLKNGRIVVRS